MLKLFLFLILFSSTTQAQIYLQLEEKNNPEVIRKMHIDQTLIFKLKAYPESWRTQRIFDILPKENVIVFDENLFKPDDISMLQFKRPWAKSIGNKMVQFGVAWYAYGGLASLGISQYRMSRREAIIGASIAGVGLLLKPLFYKKNIRLGKNFNLRIVDLRFSTF